VHGGSEWEGWEEGAKGEGKGRGDQYKYTTKSKGKEAGHGHLREYWKEMDGRTLGRRSSTGVVASKADTNVTRSAAATVIGVVRMYIAEQRGIK
jgi:hypothetical protein